MQRENVFHFAGIFNTVLLFSAYNIRKLVTDVDLMLNDLARMNEIFEQGVDNLNIIFGRLQQESQGNLSIYEVEPPEMRGEDNEEESSKIDFH